MWIRTPGSFFGLVSRLPVRLSQPIFVPTSTAASPSRTFPFSCAMSSPEPMSMTISFLLSTPPQAAPSPLSIPTTTASQTLGAEPWSGTSVAPPVLPAPLQELESDFVTMEKTAAPPSQPVAATRSLIHLTIMSLVARRGSAPFVVPTLSLRIPLQYQTTAVLPPKSSLPCVSNHSQTSRFPLIPSPTLLCQPIILTPNNPIYHAPSHHSISAPVPHPQRILASPRVR